ncbi:MAG: hypothetical protein F9B45_16905 [Phycisphaera sp. RhM]|nr:hypothetical protein [Phycisphaera sp. RhM]
MHKLSSQLVGTWRYLGFGLTPDDLTLRAEFFLTFNRDGTSVTDPSGLADSQKPPRPDQWSIETLRTRPDLAFAVPEDKNAILLVQIGLIPPMPEYGVNDWVGEEEVVIIDTLLKTKLILRSIGFDDERIYYTVYRRLTKKQLKDYQGGRLHPRAQTQVSKPKRGRTNG